ncbi:MAG: DUF1015 domain-containing protein [Nitrospiraceae bacterium]|nr:DUF1015 domain-containing protein [Nitrospiraceae bacterium]
MTKISPFRGILYNTSKVSGEDVVAPPYDIITPEYKETLYRKSPYNIVRIDFGKEQEDDNGSANKYTRAAQNLSQWLKDEILINTKKPCYYVYEIEYKINDRQKKLKGFFGLVKLEELGKGIYPHECTHSKPKTDRLNLMKSCDANTSPIFSLYNSHEKKASDIIEKTMALKPYMEAKDPENAVHRLWIVEDEKDIDIISRDLEGRAIFIADGHHRYETALEFQREMKNKNLDCTGNEPFNYVLMFLANISAEDLTILPAHRLVHGFSEDSLKILSDYFDVEPLREENMESAMSAQKHAIGLSYVDRVENSLKQYIMRHKGKGLKDIHPALVDLDVTVLHELIFGTLLKITDIAYEMSSEETLSMVKKGLYDAAFSLKPTKVEDVERVALSGVRMPPKSTYFYPKLFTGFVINSFRNNL